MKKKKTPIAEFKFNKGVNTIIKDFEKYKFRNGGFVQIGTNPAAPNMFFQEYPTEPDKPNDPIKEWSERWLENELGKK